MKWYLVVYALGCLNNGGLDPGIIPGNCSYRETIKIEMPSLEICRQASEANRYLRAECWAKDETGLVLGLGNSPLTGYGSSTLPFVGGIK